MKIAVTVIAGSASGRNTLRSVCQGVAPSIQAASSRSRGMVEK